MNKQLLSTELLQSKWEPVSLWHAELDAELDVNRVAVQRMIDDSFPLRYAPKHSSEVQELLATLRND